MTYKLAFKSSALKEWQALDNSVRAQFKKILLRRLEAPRVEAAKLRDMPDCYKIKLRALGYRLVYEVADGLVTVTVIAVGRRERGEVYASAEKARTK
jgi:mRNA interferase RelE/StbE